MSRPIADRLVEKYHRAVYALDPLGQAAAVHRWALRMSWSQLCMALAQESNGPEHEAALDRMLAEMERSADVILRDHEKDRNRATWEKQRDFLVGSLRRVRKATTLDDTGHLHFFTGQEIFDVTMTHPRFQCGYRLWQGIRTELKEALSLTLHIQPVHPLVGELHAAIRRIVTALESASVEGLNHYDPMKSPLHLSTEQQGRMLWEAVREEIGKTVVMAEARVAA
jgi:hypothetical protein